MPTVPNSRSCPLAQLLKVPKWSRGLSRMSRQAKQGHTHTHTGEKGGDALGSCPRGMTMALGTEPALERPTQARGLTHRPAEPGAALPGPSVGIRKRHPL